MSTSFRHFLIIFTCLSFSINLFLYVNIIDAYMSYRSYSLFLLDNFTDAYSLVCAHLVQLMTLWLLYLTKLAIAFSLYPLKINTLLERDSQNAPGPGTYSPFFTRCPNTNLIRKANEV